MNREIIYPKDIQVLTGKCAKSSRILLNKIKAHFGKLPRHFVTISECSTYLGISVSDIRKAIM